MDELKTALYNLTGLLDDILNEMDYDAYEALLNADLIDLAVTLNDGATKLAELVEAL